MGGDNCTTVVCTLQHPFSPEPICFRMTVLPCNQPPGIRIVVKSGSVILLNEIFVESDDICLIWVGITLKVTLDQMKDALGFKVCILYTIN